MSQHDYDIANASGATVRADINSALAAIATLNAGTAAPSPTFANMLWADTTNTLLKKRNNANSGWVTIGALDSTNLALMPLSGGSFTGAFNDTDVTLASAATVNIGAAGGRSINISGVTGITAFDTVQAGTIRKLRFAGVLTWTHNATSMILPGAASITTAAGDTAEVLSLGSGNWKCFDYTRADGTSLVTAAGETTGAVKPYAGRTPPAGYLVCDGLAVSRATYAALFAVMCPTIGAFTVTLASPGVWTLNSHNLQTGERVRLTTTGALPTGLAINTDYYVIRTGANTGNFASSLANANAGTAINTSVSQSGTHTMQYFGYGVGDGSTTFNVPDLRGNIPVGADAMGQGAASRLTFASSGYNGGAIGQLGGEQTHLLTVPEIPAHTHGLSSNAAGSSTNSGGNSGSTTTGSTGGGGAHNNVQPFQAMNYIIKT